VATSLLAGGQIEFGSTVLTVVSPPSECTYNDDDNYYNESESESDSNDDNIRETTAGNSTVKVTSIPRNMSVEMLKTFLESDKIGAGPICEIQYNDGDDSAIVQFQCADGTPHTVNVSD